MKTNNVNIMKCFLISLIVIIFTIWVGSAANNIALYHNSLGVGFPLKEPLNLGFAVLCYLLLKKYFPVNHIKIKLGNLKSYLIGAIIIISQLLLAWVMAYILGQFSYNFKINHEYLPIIIGFCFLFLHGAAEELMLQAITRPVVENYFGKKIAIIITALSFTSIQYFQGYKDIFEIINSFVFALLTATFARKYGLLSAIAMHSLWTYLEVVCKNNFMETNFVNSLYSHGGTDTYRFIGFAIIGLIIYFIIESPTANKNL